jgi:hypothetical protein
MLLAKFHEAAQLKDQLQREAAKKQSFEQQIQEQRSIIHKITAKIDLDVATLTARFDALQQTREIFPQDANEKFRELEENFATHRSTLENHRRNFDQTAVADLLEAHATLRDEQRAIAQGIGDLEDIKAQKLLQEQNQDIGQQRSIIEKGFTTMKKGMEKLSIEYDNFKTIEELFSKEEKEIYTGIREDIDNYNSILNRYTENFNESKIPDLLNVHATLVKNYQSISNDMSQVHAFIFYIQETASKKISNLFEEFKKEREFQDQLRDILKKAKLELTPEADAAFRQLEKLHSQVKHEIEIPNIDNQHREAFEKLLGYLSPDTLRDFQQRNVKFVVDLGAKVFYPTVEKGENDQWKINIFMPYPYGIRGVMLRTIDLLLEIHQQQDGHIPSPDLRAEVAARAFRANERMGKMGFRREGYEMAEMYYEYYTNGRIKAFKDGRINNSTTGEEIEEIGYQYARQEYRKSAQPKDGIPRFPSMQPGAFPEEIGEWELNEGQQAVKVGSGAYHQVMLELNKRRLEGNNFTLTVNVLPPDKNSSDRKNKILVQPFYAMEGLRSHHPINAGGRHTLWAGEVDINYETKTVLRIKDQSGHFRTFVEDKPYLMIDYALNEFRLQGYNTSKTEKQLTFIEGAKEVPYRNYRPLKNPGQPMQTIEKEAQARMTSSEDERQRTQGSSTHEVRGAQDTSREPPETQKARKKFNDLISSYERKIKDKKASLEICEKIIDRDLNFLLVKSREYRNQHENRADALKQQINDYINRYQALKPQLDKELITVLPKDDQDFLSNIESSFSEISKATTKSNHDDKTSEAREAREARIILQYDIIRNKIEGTYNAIIIGLTPILDNISALSKEITSCREKNDLTDA